MAEIGESEPDSGSKSTIFAVRTTIGQEKTVLQNVFNRLRVLHPFPDLKAMMIAEELRGYIFIEAVHQRDVMITIAGMRHIKGKIVGSISLESISHVISPRKVTEILEEGDVVEIVSGVFSGQKAEVIRMPKDSSASQDVTLRLKDSDSAISIKIHGDFLKLLEKGTLNKEKYIMGDEIEVARDNDEEDDTEQPESDDSEATGEVFSFEEFSSDDEEYASAESDKDDSDDSEDDDDEEDDEWSKFSF